ncbi:MAG TPA: polyphosphate kinase 2 [Afifellaceae bacterium]|nr:polyphosphate kinase 2 [Afifellaceae bacterium]
MTSRGFDLSQFDLDDPVLPDAVADAAMQSGSFPYDKRMKKSAYQEQLLALQIELVKLLTWVQDEGERFVAVFEGRDAAGKGGTIHRVRQFLNPRQARIVALPKPTDRERGQWYFQRYVDNFPTTGEMILFDRSWYNRGVVEPVMGFCTREQTDRFLVEAPHFEHMLKRDGIRLFKFWLNIGREMQLKRFHDRRHDPLKSWKISPVDLKAIEMWDDFTRARDRMIEATHTEESPWTIVRANDKRRARIEVIRHMLANTPYAGKDKAAIGEADLQIIGQGPDFLD